MARNKQAQQAVDGYPRQLDNLHAKEEPELPHSELVGLWRAEFRILGSIQEYRILRTGILGPIQEYRILRTEDGQLQFMMQLSRNSKEFMVSGILEPQGRWLQATVFPEALVAGSPVTIKGVTSVDFVHLNGKRGTLKSWDDTKQRWWFEGSDGRSWIVAPVLLQAACVGDVRLSLVKENGTLVGNWRGEGASHWIRDLVAHKVVEEAPNAKFRFGMTLESILTYLSLDMRRDEDLKSPQVAVLTPGTWVTVLDVGVGPTGNYIRVHAESKDVTGWVKVRTTCSRELWRVVSQGPCAEQCAGTSASASSSSAPASSQSTFCPESRGASAEDASKNTSREQKEDAKLAAEEKVTKPREFKKDWKSFSLSCLHSRVEVLMPCRVSDNILLLQAFNSLVDALVQGGELERLTDQWLDSAAFAGVTGTRNALRERQAGLRRVEESALQTEILARDEARAAHVEGLQQALGAILLATACASVDELDEAISAETVFVARRVVALSTARSVAIMHPGIGSDAPPDRGADGEVNVTVKAAAERYDQYLKAYASRRDAMTSATNSAVKAVRGELLSTPLFEEGDHSEAQGSSIPGIKTDAKALDAVKKYISTACIAADQELAFWDGKPHEVTLPASQLLIAGTKQLDTGIQRLEALRRARRTYAVLSAELAEEEQALATEKHRDPALHDMNLAFSEHLDATFALEDAERHVERSRRRGLPASSADDAAIQAAKESAKKSQMKLHAAMHKVIQLMTWYPEAARDKVVSQHLHISMPADLLPLWRAERTVGHFDTCERVAMSKHAVYKVTEGDRAYALKEYNLVGGEDALRRSLREAAFLVRARHPNIASIEAVFTDASRNSMYLQMPFYKHGSLDQWVKEEQPDDLSIRRSLAHVATAIAHLHGLGIVHADVKPPNIFINEHGMAHLGDFDISVDGSTRTSVSYLQTTMMQVGFTIGFAAPELFKSGASFATDVFAFGATLSSVAHPSPERDALAAELQASEPSSRPEIKTVLGSSFFAPTFTWVREQRRRCSICLEDGIALEEGLECSGEGLHFLCGACLKQYTEVQCQETMRARQATEGRVLCPSPGCHTPYCDSDLAGRLDAATFLKYIDARVDLVEQRRSQELEEAMETRLAAELQRLRALDEEQRELLAVRKHIEEDILTLKCPRCGQAFIDFEGCFALRCSRCPCGFCAWCGEDSGGNDAHAHVRQCRAKPRGADVFFGARQQFDEAQQRRRRARLLEYLPTLNARVRSAVLRELRPRLDEFGLGDVLRQAG